MKLISLNTLGGYFYKPLMIFLKQQAQTTDIFLLQEIHDTTIEPRVIRGFPTNFFSQLQDVLPDFAGNFSMDQEGCVLGEDRMPGVNYGKATFIKKNLAIKNRGEIFIYRERNSFDFVDGKTLPCTMAYASMAIGESLLTVCNVHGAYLPGTKRDTTERIAQSNRIIECADAQPGEKIIAGDFNLMPDTESIELFERHGYRNLINDYKISETRGSLNEQLHPEYAKPTMGLQHFADFTFVTASVQVKSFMVPDAMVSDHLPMIVEFNL